MSSRVRRQSFRYDSQRSALEEWFTENRWRKVFPVLSGHDPDSVSLRLLELLADERFLAECRRRQVPLEYVIETTTQRRHFDLPLELQAMQAVYRKKFMEPFARQNPDLPDGGRFVFGHDRQTVETNVAQLQFMRFMVENSVLDWVRLNKEAIFEIKQALEG